MIFKAIISRDHGCPWGDANMTSAAWLNVPTATITINRLVATQPSVHLHAIPTFHALGGDQYPHVISHKGEHYLEDGHHRVVTAWANGQRTIRARILSLPC